MIMDILNIGITDYKDSSTQSQAIAVTGTEFNYYLLCKRKLWLFSRNVEMEYTSDNVLIGKLIDEETYQREKKGIVIDGAVKIDFLDDNVVHEVKKSDKMEEVHIGQVLYYIYRLRQRGVDIRKGIINYPKQKRTTEVMLTSEKEDEIKDTVKKIIEIKNAELPPDVLNSKICKKCSYEDFCYS
jgi:CRISPR-associated exonuclease Cas4